MPPSPKRTTEQNDVTVVGGGLAGMVAALRLLQRGFSVQILEGSNRLGGKAGADQHGSDWDEHGWHIFPIWYLNIFALADELGFIGRFRDRTKYGYMAAGRYPETKYFENLFSWRFALKNLFSGVLSPPESFLCQYAGIDLMSRAYRYRRQLDQIALNGFVRSRWYSTESVVRQFEENITRASAIESYEMSAMTVRNVLRYWFTYNAPWVKILNTDLQQGFIHPILAQLERLGCTIRLNHVVDSLECREGRISALKVSHNDENTRELVTNDLLMAVAVEDLVPLLSPAILKADHRLGRLFYLRSRIMGGLTIYLNKKVHDIPQFHINFVDSPHRLSMIDVTDTWGRTDGSIICVVASDLTSLAGHTESEAEAVLLTDLQRYLPFLGETGIIARTDFQPHFEHPLFANTAGMWRNRPEASTAIGNLYLAGDYCRSHIDLTCMEGAVSTGLLAAEAIRMKDGRGTTIENLVPKTKSTSSLCAIKCLLFPVALLAYIITRLGRSNR